MDEVHVEKAADGEAVVEPRPGDRHVPVLGREFAVAAAALVALAIVGLITWVTVHDEPARAHVGDVFRGGELSEPDVRTSSSGRPRPHDPVSSTSVSLPWGRVDLMVSAPMSSLPDDVQQNVGAVHAPDGGRFVGVSVTEVDPVTDPAAPSFAPYPRTHLSLVVDGRTLPLDTPTSAQDPCLAAVCGTGLVVDDAPYWIAVPGSAATVLVAAEYDGVTQTVDVHSQRRTPGAAAALYPRAEPGTICSAPTLPTGYTDAHPTSVCVATIYRTPYLPRLGWARAGMQWITVVPRIDPPDILTRAAQGRTGSTDYRSADASFTAAVRIPGAAPVGPLVPPTTDLTSAALSSASAQVFTAPSALTGTATLTASPAYVSNDDSDGAPPTVPVSLPLTWTGQL